MAAKNRMLTLLAALDDHVRHRGSPERAAIEKLSRSKAGKLQAARFLKGYDLDISSDVDVTTFVNMVWASSTFNERKGRRPQAPPGGLELLQNCHAVLKRGKLKTKSTILRVVRARNPELRELTPGALSKRFTRTIEFANRNLKSSRKWKAVLDDLSALERKQQYNIDRKQSKRSRAE
jgi:hypothetical protein